MTDTSATACAPERDGPDFELTGYVTAYVDLLGLSRRLELLDEMFEDGHSESKLVSDLRSSIGSILRLRSGFESYFHQFSADPSQAGRPMTPAQSREWQKLRSPDLTTRFVGDAVILSVRIRLDNLGASWIGVHRILGAVACTTVRLLAAGQPCRGGIEIGTGCEMTPGEIVGGALARAYRLEQQMARWPRVLVGPRLLDLLRTISDPMRVGGSRVERTLAVRILDMLTPDDDGQHFVDFLAPEVFKALPHDMAQSCTDRIRSAVELELSESIRFGDERRADKYRWLERYLNGRVPPRGPPAET